jgi:hypothetical protein
MTSTIICAVLCLSAVCIGVNAQYTSITQDLYTGAITISADVHITGKVMIDSNAYIGYTNYPTSTSYGLYVGSSGASIANSAYTSTCGSSCFASDQLLKINIVPSVDPSVLEKMANVGRYKWQYTPGYSACDSCVIDGFIAQNFLVQFPDVVESITNYQWTNANTGVTQTLPQMYMLNYDRMIPHIWDAVLQLNTNLKYNVTNLSLSLGGVGTAINSLTTSHTSLNEKVTTLSGKVNSNAQATVTNANTIAALTARVTALEASVAALSALVTKLTPLPGVITPLSPATSNSTILTP